MVWNWFRRHPLLIHVALVVLLGGLYVVTAVHQREEAPGVALALLQTVPLFWRRSRPFAVLAIVTAGAVVSGFAYDLILPFAPAVATYTVTVEASRLRSAIATVAALVAMATTSADAT